MNLFIFKALVNFTDEEGYGKYLDLNELYQKFINLKGLEVSIKLFNFRAPHSLNYNLTRKSIILLIFQPMTIFSKYHEKEKIKIILNTYKACLIICLIICNE